MKSKIVLGAVLAALSSTSSALELITGNVTAVEPTYLPNAVSFQIDVGNVTCPVGKWLVWAKPDQSNNKAVYATLMTALVTGKKVNFLINNGDSTCVGQYLHLLNN